MARLKQTQRKRVGSVPRLPVDVVAAIAAEAHEIEDPEMFEREHDEALLDVEDQEEPEMEEDEEDPSEESETEVIAILDEEDPDDVPVAEERVGVMVVYTASESSDPPSEKYEYEAEVSRLMDLIINRLYRNKEVFLRELISVTNSELIKDEVDLDIRIQADKDNRIITITNSDIGMISEELVDCLVGPTSGPHFLEILSGKAIYGVVRVAVAEARLDEVRRELDAERAGRRTRAYETRATIPRSLRRELTGIELTSRARLRSLQGDMHGRISRRQADYIFRRVMERVWELTRSGV
ncbi:hypothetical protein AgCh_000621 [Apium graveolens]